HAEAAGHLALADIKPFTCVTQHRAQCPGTRAAGAEGMHEPTLAVTGSHKTPLDRCIACLIRIVDSERHHHIITTCSAPIRSVTCRTRRTGGLSSAATARVGPAT